MIPRAERRVKPLGEWRSFRNAGDEDCRFVELITPAGFEAMFKEMAENPEAMAGHAAAALDAKYSIYVYYDGIDRLCAAHGLSFPA